MDGTVLIADDDRAIRTVLTQAFTRAGCKVRSTGSASTLWRWVEEGEGDVVVSDVVMPDGDGLEMLPAIRRRRADLPVIVISARNTVLTAVRAAEAGAYDYLPKPFDLKDLMLKVSRALSPVHKPGFAGGEANGSLPLVGSSPAMQSVYRVLARVLNTDLNVMISGESGTGKDLVAGTLHSLGHRRNMPFVTVDSASVTPEQLESVFLGDGHAGEAGHDVYVPTGTDSIDDSEIGIEGLRSAATGVEPESGIPDDDSAGSVFLTREQGAATVYLDDVGELSAEAQNRLLSLLRNNSSENRSHRLISSTRQPVADLLQRGLFREDLFFRLNVITIYLPPLRERLQDLPELTTHFLQSFGSTNGLFKTISRKGLDHMRTAHWPGNVHELRNFIQRLALLCPEEEIGYEFVSEALRHTSINRAESELEDNMNLSTVVEDRIRRYFDLFGDRLPPPRTLQQDHSPGRIASHCADPCVHTRKSDSCGVTPWNQSEHAEKEDPRPEHRSDADPKAVVSGVVADRAESGSRAGLTKDQ